MLNNLLGANGVGEWCAPGPAAEQKQQWLLVFEDADRRMLVFDDEQAARTAFWRAEGSGWNCHLFETARRADLKAQMQISSEREASARLTDEHGLAMVDIKRKIDEDLDK